MSEAAPVHALDEALVGRLLARQFPQWRDLPLSRLEAAGADNAIFRLGQNLTVRLPLSADAARTHIREQTWLPRLAPHLPLATPAPIALGEPGEDYPFAWSICPWLDGRDAVATPPADMAQAGRDLGAFLRALRAVDASGGPAAGPDNHGRGMALVHLDRRVRRDLARLDDAAVTALWDDALATPEHTAAGVWVHGDLHPGNLVVEDGRLAGVLDFGLMAVGDPACDLIVAWTLLDGAGRAALRQALGDDEAAWRRARGWAVYCAVIVLAFYPDTHPLWRSARRSLDRVLGLADQAAPYKLPPGIDGLEDRGPG